MKRMTMSLCLLMMSVGSAVAADTFESLSQFLDFDGYRKVEGVRKVMDKAFDNVCGDTFCEGEYSNLKSLDFECSVNTANGVLKECVWTFAGSRVDTDAKTGKMKLASKAVTACKINVSGIQWKSFIDQVNAYARQPNAEALDVILKGKQTSIYDQIADCL